jgi:CheY-like chemotaxis protein
MIDFRSLKGVRVLVVEDDALFAKSTKQMLFRLGCVVTGTATSVEEAHAAIKEPVAFDCVILDVRLGPEITSNIAGDLVRREVPLVVCSGYDIRLPGMNIPVLSKPHTLGELRKALMKALRFLQPTVAEAPKFGLA